MTDETARYTGLRPDPSQRSFDTHAVDNVPPVLGASNFYLEDQALCGVVEREGIGWVHGRAVEVGRLAGSTHFHELAQLANHRKPQLETHDGVGNRIDHVDYHPAYHEIMAANWSTETHSLPWTVDEPGGQTARNVIYYLWNLVENGTVSCPNAMTWAIVPLLRSDPEIGERWLSGVLSTKYDPRPLPAADKDGLSVAMAMTEKQGGSDVRANTTRATPTGEGREYLLTGHKYFVSAPMGDILLLTAQTDAGVSLFICPRFLDNGDLNNVRIQRLKPKLGNSSNATSEVELVDAVAYRIGEEGRGIASFVKHMTHYLRMALATGSAGIMRRALIEAAHHTTHRKAFGSTIRDQPMMQNTLADLAIESEAAMLLGMRVTRACDNAENNESEELLNRVLVPIAKYWNCRRVSSVTLEALECHGGLGYIEERPVSLLYREAPLNSVWEGTGVIMGLDVQRSLLKTPGVRDALMGELDLATGSDRNYDEYVLGLKTEFDKYVDDFEPHARRLMSMTAVAAQASLMIRQSTPEVADAFCASRLGGHWAHEYGTLDQPASQLRQIVDRAVPSKN